MISIVDGATSAAVAATQKPPRQADADIVGNREAGVSRRMEVGMVVSQAFDSTLVKLARELRSLMPSRGGGSRGGVKGASSFLQPESALSCVAGAGVFLDAYETAFARLLQAFNCLAELSREPSEGQSSLDSDRRSYASQPPTSPAGTSLANGVWAGGWGSAARRGSWIQEKLEVLGECAFE